MIVPNAMINVKRRNDPDFSGARTLYSVMPNLAARFRRRRSSTVDNDGMVIATDADLRVSAIYDIQIYDVIEQTNRLGVFYQIEDLEEVQNASGRVVAYDMRLTRAESIE